MVIIKARKKMDINQITAILRLKQKEKRPDIIYLIGHWESMQISEGERANICQYLESLNLMRNERITSDGERAIKSGYIMMPESGVYNLFYVQDALFGKDPYVIHFSRMTSSKKNDDSAEPYDEFDAIDQKSFSSLKDDTEFHITFERNRNGDVPVVTKRPRMAADIELISSLNKVAMLKIRSHDALDLNYEDKNRNLNLESNLPGIIQHWDNALQAQLVSFDEVKSDETQLKNFHKNIPFIENRTLLLNGIPDKEYKIEIQELPILPKTETDAELWLLRLLILKIKDNLCYLTKKHVEELEKEILEKTPFRKKFEILFIQGDKVFESIKKDSNEIELFRNIQTAEDLYPDSDICGGL